MWGVGKRDGFLKSCLWGQCKAVHHSSHYQVRREDPASVILNPGVGRTAAADWWATHPDHTAEVVLFSVVGLNLLKNSDIVLAVAGS